MTVLASDQFSRTQSLTWGTSSDGTSVWTHPLGTDTLSVNGTVGLVTYATGVANVMLCGALTSLPTDGRTQFQCSDATSSQAGVAARATALGTTYYALVYRFALQKLFLVRVVAGVITTLSSSLFTADTSHVYHLHVRVAGTAPVHIGGRIWLYDTTEPTTWNVAASDSAPARIAVAGQFGLLAQPGISGASVAFGGALFGDMNLGTYKDCTTLQCRVLGPQDVAQLGGVIATRSGNTSFQAEDFLCKNFSGQWVIPHAAFMALGMERLSDVDGQGFYIYSIAGGNRTVTVTDQDDGTVLCSDGTIADSATFASGYVS